MQRHRPAPMPHNHAHSQIEINLPIACSMSYQFGPHRYTIPDGRIALFSALTPHRVVEVHGDGEVVVAYLPIGSTEHWALPAALQRAIFDGHVALSTSSHDIERQLMLQWFEDYRSGVPARQGLAAQEVLLRLKRMDLEGWINLATDDPVKAITNPTESRRVHRMLEYIGAHYTMDLRPKHVAIAANLSPNYAMEVFRRGTGKPIGQYISELRLNLASARLIDSNDRVAVIALEVGFASLSAFYEAFGKRFGLSPRRFRLKYRALEDTP